GARRERRRQGILSRYRRRPAQIVPRRQTLSAAQALAGVNVCTLTARRLPQGAGRTSFEGLASLGRLRVTGGDRCLFAVRACVANTTTRWKRAIPTSAAASFSAACPISLRSP